MNNLHVWILKRWNTYIIKTLPSEEHDTPESEIGQNDSETASPSCNPSDDAGSFHFVAKSFKAAFSVDVQSCDVYTGKVTHSTSMKATRRRVGASGDQFLENPMVIKSTGLKME